MSTAPLLFVGHGSPMFALDAGQAAQNLSRRSNYLDGVDAILVISPHWITQRNFVTTSERPRTIHDFSGFPDSLNRIHYPAPGSGRIGLQVIDLLKRNGLDAQADNDRGWDHGVWVPLLHLRPNADKVVIQLSLNASMSVDQLENLGRSLTQLREQNIAIICSGSVTHNLYDIRMSSSDSADYAREFEKWVREMVLAGNMEDLKQAQNKSPHYDNSHPTSEHFLPLIIAMATRVNTDKVDVLQSPITHHTISMESYLWAVPDHL